MKHTTNKKPTKVIDYSDELYKTDYRHMTEIFFFTFYICFFFCSCQTKENNTNRDFKLLKKQYNDLKEFNEKEGKVLNDSFKTITIKSIEKPQFCIENSVSLLYKYINRI